MFERESATTGASVLRGGVWYAGSRSIPYLYALVLSIVAARFLGPEGMGRQSFIAFVALSLALLLTRGMFLALMRYVGEMVGRGEPELLRGLLAWALRIELGGAALGACILVATALLGAEPQNAWLLAAAVCALSVLHSVPSAVLIGAQRWRQASLVGLVTGIAGTLGTISVLDAGGGITGMFAVEALIALVNLAWTGVFAQRALGEVERRPAVVLESARQRELRRAVISFAAFVSVSEALAFVVERRSELFFLERFSTETEIALYSIVFSMVVALAQVPAAMAATMSPAVATLFGAGALERIRSGYARARRMLLITTVPLVAAGLSVGPAVLRIVYGDEYGGTRPVLLVTVTVLPVVPLAALASALITGLGRPRLLVVSSSLAAGVDVVLAAIFVPRHGAVGAALANVGAQTVLAGCLLAFARRLVGPLDWELWAVARTVLAAVGAGLLGSASVMAFGDTLGVVVGGLGGTVCFGLLAIALGILPAVDAAWLEDTLGRHLGGGVGRFCRLCASRPVLGPT